MRIPEVRARLEELADQHNLPELRFLAHELKRRVHNRRAPTRSKPIGDQLAHYIRVYAEAHPDASFTEIAGVWDVNPGRVSEILYGKRE